MNNDISNFSIPEYTCKKISKKIELSGKMDDPIWQTAEPIKLMDAVSGEPGRFATLVRALYYDEFLYVGFKCEDDYVWGTVTEKDGPIWEEECVEVFLNPACVKHQYYEINVSPKNVVFQSVILNNRTIEKQNEKFIGLTDWEAEGLKIVTHIDGKVDSPGEATGWSAEYAIPFSQLIGAPNIPPKPEDEWRVNFYRIDSPQKGQQEHYAWSKTGRVAFHMPWRFGKIKFE